MKYALSRSGLRSTNGLAVEYNSSYTSLKQKTFFLNLEIDTSSVSNPTSRASSHGGGGLRATDLGMDRDTQGNVEKSRFQ